MNLKELIGKTIIKAKIRKLKGYDDAPDLYLEMTDGTKFKIHSWYGSYTGKSEDEYPLYINVEKIKKEMI